MKAEIRHFYDCCIACSMFFTIPFFIVGIILYFTANAYSPSELAERRDVAYGLCSTNQCILSSVNETCATINAIMVTKHGELIDPACGVLCDGKYNCSFVNRQNCLSDCISAWKRFQTMESYRQEHDSLYLGSVILFVFGGVTFLLACFDYNRKKF